MTQTWLDKSMYNYLNIVFGIRLKTVQTFTHNNNLTLKFDYPPPPRPGKLTRVFFSIKTVDVQHKIFAQNLQTHSS